MTASNLPVSPGFTIRLKRISSMPAKSPRPSRYSGRLIAITVAVCAQLSTRITPGTIGFPGKWPAWYHSVPVNVCSATARTPGSSSVMRSMSRKGSRCGMSRSMPARSSVVTRASLFLPSRCHSTFRTRSSRMNRSSLGLRQIVADVAEDVRELIAEEDHRDDDRDGDDGDDECVFDKTLAGVIAKEADHPMRLQW